MSYIAKSRFHHSKLPVNELGLTERDYEGPLSSLCAGCGHDSISASIVQACHEISIEPHRIAKLSGIGCSSKTPNYYLQKSHGFNSVHGRMPSIATGANAANKDLVYIGMSGDGDSASIGLGQFCHAVRRKLNMVYIIANNGTYGLTKGQNSAMTDLGSKSKKGEENPFESIDVANVALQLGATFVARSFSGDKSQFVPLLKAAIAHRGFAVIDCLSPCVTFNNHAGSTKSYDFVRDHNEALNRADFVPMKEEIVTQYAPGSSKEVCLHDGSVLHLHKLAEDYDPTDPVEASYYMQKKQREGKVLTGLIYVNTDSPDLHEIINTVDKPLNQLVKTDLCPGSKTLQNINESFC